MSEILITLNQRRLDAASLLMVITGGETAPLAPFEIPGALARSGLARARNGDDSNCIFRNIVMFISLRKAGRCRADAEAVMAMYEALIEELWPIGELNTRAAINRAQASDTSEDYLETLAHDDQVSPAARAVRVDRWIEATLLHIADARVKVACLRRDRRGMESTTSMVA